MPFSYTLLSVAYRYPLVSVSSDVAAGSLQTRRIVVHREVKRSQPDKHERTDWIARAVGRLESCWNEIQSSSDADPNRRPMGSRDFANNPKLRGAHVEPGCRQAHTQSEII